MAVATPGALIPEPIRRRLHAPIARWALFNVIIALIPFVFNWLCVITLVETPGAIPVPLLERLFARGELLLVSSAIAADAIGHLVAVGSKKETEQVWCVGLSLVLLLLSALWYGFIASHAGTSAHINTGRVSVGSVILLIGILICSLCSLIVSELGR